MEEIVCQLPERLLPWFAEHRGGTCLGGRTGNPTTSGYRRLCCSRPVWRLYVGITPDF